MEKRMVNEHYHDPFDLSKKNDSSPSSTSSFYNPLKLFPLSDPPPPPSPSSSSVCAGTTGDGLSYIEHSVSKFDTLAGLAIKYGVEVPDIKKLNGLVTDHQMFARKTLQIPLSERNLSCSFISDAPDNHGPNNSDQDRKKVAFFESFKLGASPLLDVSPAMITRQGYYGLDPVEEKSHSEGLEMAVYHKGESLYPLDGPFTMSVTPSNAPLSHHRKCKSVAFDLYAKSILGNDEETKENGSDNLIEDILRSRKSEVDLISKAPEMLLKEDVSSGSVFSPLGSKGLALRSKSVSRTVSGVDTEGGFPSSLGNAGKVKNSNGFRRSSSTTSLQDSENNSTSSSSWLSSKWSLKADLQALSTSSIAKPIFDGLPKPITGKKVKAAVD